MAQKIIRLYSKTTHERMAEGPSFGTPEWAPVRAIRAGVPGRFRSGPRVAMSTMISSDINLVGFMADLLLRNLSDDDITAVDARSTRLGLSRNEYLRRLVHRDVDARSVTVGDLCDFAAVFGDLDDPDVMSGAWE